MNPRHTNALSGLLGLVVVGTAVAQVDSSFVRYYYDEPLPMPLDVAEIAVFKAGSVPAERAGIMQDHDVLAANVVPLIPGWSRSQTPPDVRSGHDVEALVRRLADESTLDFVSPVFLDGAGHPLIVTDEILVRFWPETPDTVAQAVLAASVAGEITHTDWAGMPGAYRVRVESRNGFEVLEAANALARRSDVKWAEPNMVATAVKHLIPNDTLFESQWALRNTGQSGGLDDFDMDADEAWDITTGDSSVVVVIFDDGIQQDHPDINQLPGEDFTGNGTGGGPLNECDNHGTAVAGCVSAVINNGFGVAGVAPDCRVRSAKFNTSAIDTPCPGTYATFLFAWMVEALDWAVDIGAAVTNNSNGFAVSAAITDQYTFTRALGLTHFAAAGNSSVNMLSYPSSIDAVNAVAAVDRFGSLSSFSSWGTGLAYAAPGTSILTTDRTGPDGYSNGDMTSADGTSFASPYAAGVAAMVLSMNGDLPPAIVETIMDMTSMDMGAPGYDTTFGAGLVNAHQAIIATTCSPSSGGCFEDNGSPGCDIPDCCAQVCGADPFCCNTEWDAGCAQQASETCGNCGLPGSGNCFFPGGSVTPGCEDLQCCQTICAIDPFCCETQWDGTCAAQANDLCPPPNDDCSNAVYVVGNTTYNGNLIAATPDGAATCAEPQSNPDIWYSFVAPDDGTLFASTCGTHDLPGQDDGVDTILSAHTGCPGSTSNQIACNDDNGAVCSGDLGWPRDAAIEVSVVAGQVVYLRVSHYATHVADGAIKLNIDFEAFIPNNVCSQALPITNIGATFCNEGTDTDGPSPCGDLGSDIWYTYESSHTGTITVPTCASGFDTVVAVYDGCDCTPGLDRLLGCNDDFCIPLASSVTVPVVAGGCYLIQVGGFDGAQGCGVIPNIVIDVINDDCNAALPTGAGETPFSTAGSSTDGPQPCGLQLGADVWFDYTATTTGTVTIDTCDAGHDTILAAYAGCDCPVGLDDLVACNDNGCGPQQSIISFPVVAGECFKIQIGGGFSQSGSGALTIEEDSACPADTDGSGVVDVADLVNVILAWGNDDAGADVNGDGIVDVLDLVEVIVSWGAC